MNLTEIVGISDNVRVSCCFVIDLIYFAIIGVVGIIFTLMLRYSRFYKTYAIKDLDTTKPIVTPYENLDENALQKIVDKLSRNYGILITIYGLLFAFIISQNFQHVFSRWTVIVWIGCVLAIIVRSANIALSLTDVIEKGKTMDHVAKTVYSYNQYFKHTSFLLIIIIAFSPIIFLPISDQHESDFKIWDPQISVVTIALGIMAVSFAGYHFSDADDFLRPGVPKLYFFVLSIVISESLSHINAAPLVAMPVSWLGTPLQIPQLLWLFLWVVATYVIFVGYLICRAHIMFRKEKHT